MDLTVNPYRYCGEYQDETTGLYYLRARYYDSTTGRFISADSYPGSTADPVSLHKYLYANANPVMNSDPTGYFTLYGMTAAIQVENTLRDMYNSALTGGFMSFIDTLAGEETDPYKLLQAFGNGAMEGLKSSAITASLTAVRNLGCLAPRLAMLSSLALVGLSGKSTFEALQGAVDSLLEGNYKQALFRALGFGLSAYGTYKASTAAFDTMTGVINGTKCFVAGTLVLTEDGEKPIEEIEVGDYVYSTDPETGESGYKEVLQTFVNETSELVSKISVPSGRLIVADPLVHLDSDTLPFIQKIPKGEYDVIALFATDAKGNSIITTVKVTFTDEPAEIYRNALTGKEYQVEIDDLEEGGYFCFSVDGGLVTIVDEKVKKEYLKFQNKWERKNKDEDFYDGYLMDKFIISAKEHPHFQRECGDYVYLTLPDTDYHIPMFSSGAGDGFYPVYFGYDRKNKVCSLVVEFIEVY